ncbi:hypothetical protein ACXX9E_29550 [Pseudomonas sp. GNP014]
MRCSWPALRLLAEPLVSVIGEAPCINIDLILITSRRGEHRRRQGPHVPLIAASTCTPTQPADIKRISGLDAHRAQRQRA